MQLFNTQLLIFPLLFLNGFFCAMDATDAAVKAALIGIKESIKKEDRFKAELFNYTLLKKAEKPSYPLDGYYLQKLQQVGFVDNEGNLKSSVEDVIKRWLKAGSEGRKKEFEAYLTQQK